MAKYDPLKCIPSSDSVRKRLTETETLAQKLRILLDTAERIERQSQESHDPHRNSRTRATPA